MGVWNAFECWFLPCPVLGIRSSVGKLALPLRPLYSGISLSYEMLKIYEYEIPMKYWDFSVKSKSILPLMVTSEITIFIFTVSKKRTFYEFWVKSLAKRFKM